MLPEIRNWPSAKVEMSSIAKSRWKRINSCVVSYITDAERKSYRNKIKNPPASRWTTK
jgi:hypothetical protein